MLREKSMTFATYYLKWEKEFGLHTIIEVGPTDNIEGILGSINCSLVNVVCCLRTLEFNICSKIRTF